MSCCTSRDSRPPAHRRRNEDPNRINASATNPAITQPRLVVTPAVASSTAIWVNNGVNAPRPTPPSAATAASTVITGCRQQYPHSRRNHRGRSAGSTVAAEALTGCRFRLSAVAPAGPAEVDVDGGTSPR